MDAPIPLSEDQRAINHVDVPGVAWDGVERHAHAFLDAIDDHLAVLYSSTSLVEIATVIGARVIGEQLIAAPDFAITGLALIGGHEQDLDLDIDIRLDDQILALATEVQHVGPDVTIGLVIDDKSCRALRCVAGLGGKRESRQCQ